MSPRERALAVRDQLNAKTYHQHEDFRADLVHLVERAIAGAVMAEREACAKVADLEAETVIARNDMSEYRIAGMGQTIARAIRRRSTP